MNIQAKVPANRSAAAPSATKALPLQEGDVGAPNHALSGFQTVRSLEKRRLQCYLMMMIGDLVAIAIGFAIGSFVRNGIPHAPEAMRQAQLLAPIFLTVALYNRCYSVSALASYIQSAGRVIQALLLATGIVLLIAFFSKTGGLYSRMTFAAGIIATAGTLMGMRYLMRGVVSWRCGAQVENVLIVEDEGPEIDLPTAHRVSAAQHGLLPDIADPHALDRLSRWLSPMDRVIVSCTNARRRAWAMALKGLSVEGEIIDDDVKALGALGARSAGGHGLLLVSHRPLSLRDRALKRGLDLAISIPALIVISPLLIVVAVAIRMEDGGPAMFVQKRTGRGNRIFSIYKFRSMKVSREDTGGVTSASREDERLTRLGRFVRRTSIDELPQLFNVVKGDMSLVGPRPHALASRAGQTLFWDIDDRYLQRHSLRPGLTGLAQVRGYRGATDSENDLVMRLQADLHYLDGWSIWKDIGILMATLRVVIHEKAF
ncbi:sugar transferase [Croceicoccus bisphenolivorans]|uniref:sugar transferase n=1 Tax=Croceicoccus bisphenolivorans TaxID=1783232 RepID=UPI000AAA2ECC|nr:sugar transferase [Croceicoccus bisphenolivorans]